MLSLNKSKSKIKLHEQVAQFSTVPSYYTALSLSTHTHDFIESFLQPPSKEAKISLIDRWSCTICRRCLKADDHSTIAPLKGNFQKE